MKQCICETCKKEFQVTNAQPGRFCCRACYIASFPKRASCKCEGCGGMFTPFPKSHKDRRFCSLACYRTNVNGKTHSQYQHDATVVHCKQCGTAVRITSGARDILFCGSACWRKYQKSHPTQGRGVCPQCGIGFLRIRKTQVCCSDKCRHKYYRLEKNGNWNGGKTTSSDGAILVHSRKKRGKGKFPDVPLYLLQHRVIIEEAIGRELFSEERIWHIDRDLSNNRLYNLYIFKSHGEMMRAFYRQLPTRSNIIQETATVEPEGI